MRTTLYTLAVLCAAWSSSAQPVQVADIRPGAGGSEPAMTTIFGNRLIFFADDGTNGRELYYYNGLTAPTFLYDINTQAANGYVGGLLGSMPELQGKLYFAADNGVYGNELWSWDGSNNPSMVQDIVAGAPGSDPHDIVSFNNKIYFAAATVAEGDELWVFDPFSNMATGLGDLNPGTSDGHPVFLTPFQNKLYFAATDPANGTELFVYDPALNTTTLVADIETGSASSSPADLAVVGNRIYFSATTAAHGRELYSFDGSSTVRLSDINTGAGNSLPSVTPGSTVIGSLNGIIYFRADNGSGAQLYRYVPGTNTVSMAHDIYPGGDCRASSFCIYKQRVFFSAANAANGNELWAYDGITAPVRIGDINPGAGDSNPVNLVVWDTVLYFTADDGTTGPELYKYDGSTTGIEKVNQIASAQVYPNPNKGAFMIKFNERFSSGWQAKVYNLAGQVVYSSGLLQKQEHYIKLKENLPNGVYMLQLIAGTEVKNIPLNIAR